MAEESNLKTKTARGLWWGGMNNAVQQLLGVAFGIILGRLLYPEDYGMIAMITIFSLLANELQWSGFKPALTNLKNPTHDDYNAVFWFNITVSSSLYVVLFFCAPLIAAYYHKPALVPLCRYVFLGFVLSSLGAAQGAVLFKRLMAREQAIAGFTAVLLSNTIGVTMAYLGFRYWSLATQSLVYVATVSALYWYYSPWRPSLRINLRPLKAMIGFSVKVMVTAIVNIINNNILNVLLGRYYSVTETGYYNQAFQWNVKSTYTLQGMVIQVAQPVLVEVGDNRERELRVLRKLVRFTSFVAFPVLLGFGMIAPEFITVTITERWLPSASLLQMLTVAGAFAPLTVLFHNTIMSHGKSNVYMWSSIALGVTQLTAIFSLLYCLRKPPIAVIVAAIVTVNVLWVPVWHHFVKRLTGYRVRHFLADILPFLLVTVAVLAVTYFVTRGITTLWLLLTVRIVMAALLYCAVMKVARVVIFDETLAFLKSLFKKKH